MEQNSEAQLSANRTESVSAEAETRLNKLTARVNKLLDSLKDRGIFIPEKMINAAQGIGLSAKKTTQAAVLATTLLGACAGAMPQQAYAEAPAATPTPIVITVESGAKGSPSETSSVIIKKIEPLSPKTDESQKTNIQPAEAEVIKKNENPELRIGATLAAEKDNPSWEKISFTLPKDIPKRDLLSLFFELDSAVPIEKISIPVSQWVLDDAGGLTIDAPVSSIAQRLDFSSKLQESLSKEGVSIQNPDILEKINVFYGLSPEGKLMFAIHIPNEQLFLKESDGRTKNINPSDIFEKNFFLKISRRGQLPPGTVLGPIDLEVKNFTVSTNGNKLFKSPNFKLTFETKSPAIESIKAAQEIPTKKSEKNKWQREWKPNERIELKDWYEDMVSQGFIYVDSLAQQFAKEELENLINNSHLVPNPDKYWENGYPFRGNFQKRLKELEEKSQGHIRIDPQVFENIPGGENCDLYSNEK